MIQGGCPEGTGMGGPGYSIIGEFDDNGISNTLKHDAGGYFYGAFYDAKFGWFSVFYYARKISSFRWTICSIWKNN